jgi:hypothetical protein
VRVCLITLFAGWWLVLVLMQICCERKILLNGWLISSSEQGEYLLDAGEDMLSLFLTEKRIPQTIF